MWSVQGEAVPPAHHLSPRRAPGSPPLSDSPGPARGLSPQERPQQPLGTQKILGLLLPTQASPGPRQSLGALPEMGTGPETSYFLLNTIPHPSETPVLLSPGPVSDPLWEAG